MQALEVFNMNHGSVLIMENVNIAQNKGPLVINTVENLQLLNFMDQTLLPTMIQDIQ